nr:unnamed protein product [Callosobruchus chinensis]
MKGLVQSGFIPDAYVDKRIYKLKFINDSFENFFYRHCFNGRNKTQTKLNDEKADNLTILRDTVPIQAQKNTMPKETIKRATLILENLANVKDDQNVRLKINNTAEFCDVLAYPTETYLSPTFFSASRNWGCGVNVKGSRFSSQAMVNLNLPHVCTKQLTNQYCRRGDAVAMPLRLQRKRRLETAAPRPTAAPDTNVHLLIYPIVL